MTQHATTPDYGRAFALLRSQARGPWQDYTRHHFVQSLADGTLPREAFLHYLRQDYVFLVHFSRAWALAIVKSETYDEMRAATDMVNALVAEEMQMHVGICEAAGISKEKLFDTQERAENLCYTRYVLEAGYSGDFLDLIAALAPCVMGYGEIGARLAREATSDAYSDWIETYASDGYQQVCQSLGRLLDASLERRIGKAFESAPRWTGLCQKFRVATELEVSFWQMGLTP